MAYAQPKALPMASLGHNEYQLTDRPTHAAVSDLGFDQVFFLFGAPPYRLPSTFLTKRRRPWLQRRPSLRSGRSPHFQMIVSQVLLEVFLSEVEC